MTTPSMEPAIRTPTPITDRLTVLVVAGNRQYSDQIEATVCDDDEFVIRTVSTISEAFASLDDIDCLVCEYGMMTRNGAEFLDRVRRQVPDLPVVLLVDEDDESTDIVDTVGSYQWVDCLEQRLSTATVDRLAHRIRSLVERQRLDALLRRSLASIELAQDAIAIVTPDDDVEFANRSFAMQFGYDPGDLLGTPWQALFTDDTVERLETAAIPTVADGWRWTGTCTGRRKSGSTFTVRVRLGGPDDGSLVFVVDTPSTRVDDRDDETG